MVIVVVNGRRVFEEIGTEMLCEPITFAMLTIAAVHHRRRRRAILVVRLAQISIAEHVERVADYFERFRIRFGVLIRMIEQREIVERFLDLLCCRIRLDAQYRVNYSIEFNWF